MYYYGFGIRAETIIIYCRVDYYCILRSFRREYPPIRVKKQSRFQVVWLSMGTRREKVHLSIVYLYTCCSDTKLFVLLLHYFNFVLSGFTEEKKFKVKHTTLNKFTNRRIVCRLSYSSTMSAAIAITMICNSW